MEFIKKRSNYRISYISPETRICAAAHACRVLGEKAKPAVPYLIALLKSDDPILRMEASAALKSVDPIAAAEAGVK